MAMERELALRTEAMFFDRKLDWEVKETADATKAAKSKPTKGFMMTLNDQIIIAWCLELGKSVEKMVTTALFCLFVCLFARCVEENQHERMNQNHHPVRSLLV